LYSAPRRRHAVFAPGDHEIAIHLLDAADRIVVDSSMTIAIADGRVDPYDARTVTLVDTDLPVGVDAAGQHFDIAVELAPAIDGMELVDWLLGTSDDGLPSAARGDTVCVVGLASEDWVVGQTADASFSLDGETLAAGAGQSTTFCTRLPLNAPLGVTTLDVTVGAAEGSFELEVRTGTTTAALTAEQAEGGRALGDRARAAAL